MKSHSPCTIMYLLSFYIYFIMIILTLSVSSGSCNCPLSWIYIQLVSRSSREQTPHCISKEGECNKVNKCTNKKKKSQKTCKTLAKSCMYQRGQKHGKMIISVSSVCCCCCFCLCTCIFYQNEQINVRLIIKVNVIKLEQS